MPDWKSYIGQTPWVVVPKQKPSYNEGDHIATYENPVWTTPEGSAPITPAHIPCGYWTKDYVPPLFFSGEWWQQALGLFGSYVYFSVMSRNGKKLYCLRYNTSNDVWEYLYGFTFSDLVNGYTITSTSGAQGTVWAENDFTVFVNDVYISPSLRGYLISVSMNNAGDFNITLPLQLSTFRANNKAIVAYDNGTILVAYLDASKPKILKSINYGVTWGIISVDAAATSSNYLRMARNPDNNDVYVVTAYAVYRSTDAGATWAKTDSRSFTWHDTCFKDNTLYVVGGSTSTSKTLWKFVDGLYVSASTIPNTKYYPDIINTSAGLVLYESHYTGIGNCLVTSLDLSTWNVTANLQNYYFQYDWNNSISSYQNRVAFTSCGFGESQEDNLLSFMYSYDSVNWEMIEMPFSIEI